jgi:hypothetical protein
VIGGLGNLLLALKGLEAKKYLVELTQYLDWSRRGCPSALVQLYGSSNGLRRDKALLDLPQGNEDEVPIH